MIKGTKTSLYLMLIIDDWGNIFHCYYFDKQCENRIRDCHRLTEFRFASCTIILGRRTMQHFVVFVVFAGGQLSFLFWEWYGFVFMFNLLVIFILLRMLANATNCFLLISFIILCMYHKSCSWISDVKCQYSNWVDLGLCPCKNVQKIQVLAFTNVQNGTLLAKDCGKKLV